MKNLLSLIFIIISITCQAQVAGNFKEARLLNYTASDSTTSLGSTVGRIRYDPITGKYRFFNALTQTWFSYNTFSTGDFWKSVGSTTVTTPTIVGNPFFQGSVLIGPSGSTITALTSADIRGTLGGTNILRLATSTNTTVLTVSASTGISTFSNSVAVTGTNNSFSTSGNITNPNSAVFLSGHNPTHVTGVANGFQQLSVGNYSGAGTTFISFANNLGFTAGVNHTGFDHNPTNTNLISGTHLSFRSTSGQFFLANSSSDVVTASTRADLRGVSAGNILRLANSSNTRRFNFSDAGVFTIDATPTNNNAATQILARNSATGVVEYRDASSLSGSSLTSTYVGYGSGANTLTGEVEFSYDETTNTVSADNIFGNTSVATSNLIDTGSGLLITATGQQITATGSDVSLIATNGLVTATSSTDIDLTASTGDVHIVTNNLEVGLTGDFTYNDVTKWITVGAGLFGGSTAGAIQLSNTVSNQALNINTTGTGNITISTSGAGDLVLSPGDDIRITNTLATDNTPTQVLALNASNELVLKNVTSTSPGGSNLDVQYNNAGSFGGESSFAYNAALDRLSVQNITVNLDMVATSAYVTSLSAGRVVYVGAVNDELVDENDFTYNATNNTLTIGTSGSSNVVIDDGGIDIQTTGGSQLTRYRYYGIEGDGTASIGMSNTGVTNNVTLTGNSGSSIILGVATSGDIVLNTAGGGSGSYLIIQNLPTSSAGLPSGAVWSNAGVLTIVP